MGVMTADKAKIRRWVLMAVGNVKGSSGVTIQSIKKYLDSKSQGLSLQPEFKLILKKLLETGHLAKNDGKYVIKKSTKKTPGKGTKRLKSPMKKAGQGNDKKSIVDKPSKIQKTVDGN